MAAPVQQGTILAGKYRVDRVLGEGGMGVVVAATDTQLERRVAIKFLLPEYAQHHEASQRFMREARAAVKIQSEHIARVIDVNRMENGAPYMVMEFLEGFDLSQVIERQGPLPIEEAALYVVQACEAIAEAHAYGIVHRDLKPANLFLAKQPDGSSKVKVLDFGISKTVQSATGLDPSLTRTTAMMGSPLYMSPEQMKSTRDVDARTDIWALGVILYELLTGTLPFTASSVPELSAKILLEEADSLCAKRPDVPEGLERIVLRALSKKVAERYPTISELALELLPFAPQRARANVERITKVLQAAGLSTSSLDASIRPSAAGPGGSAHAAAPASFALTAPAGSTVGSATPAISGDGAVVAVTSGTQANFGSTRSSAGGSSKLGWVLGGGAALLFLGGVAVAGTMLYFKSAPLDPAVAAAAPVTSLAEAEEAKPVAVQSEKSSPGSTDVLSVKPADEPTSDDEHAAEDDGDSPTRSEPSAQAEREPAAAASRTPTKPKTTTSARDTATRSAKAKTTDSTKSATSTKTTTKTTSTKPEAPAETSGGFRSKFGSRK